MLVASQVLLWCIVLVLALAVLVLARQVGVLHERIAPVGALSIGRGPQPGEAAPRATARTLSGKPAWIGGPQPNGRMQFLMFVAPLCPVCKQLIPTALKFAAQEKIDLVMIGEGDAEEHRQMAQTYGIDPDRFYLSMDASMAYHVGKLPYAVLIEPAGTIVSQGLVNTREHLESLLGVSETGFASIQDYLTGAQPAPTPVKSREKTHA